MNRPQAQNATGRWERNFKPAVSHR